MQYRVLTPVTFGAGSLLGLTEEQARLRLQSGALELCGAMFRVATSVQFKAGEVIEHDGVLPLAQAESLVRVGQVLEASAPATLPEQVVQVLEASAPATPPAAKKVVRSKA